jgi:hypothetical protein
VEIKDAVESFGKTMDLLAIHNSADTIASRLADIRMALLQSSPSIRRGDFERIGVEDIASLVKMYDREFFGGWLDQAIRQRSHLPLSFRLSSTMTSAGGKTLRYRQRARGGGVCTRYEIAIASRMLFMTFSDVRRSVAVCGLECADRLDALLRVLEHELIHLAELLAWDESSCSTYRFRKLARDIFGHTDTKHLLVTSREHAAVAHGIRVGDMAEFDFRGRRLAGKVNRVHRRATILIEDPKGVPYTDGKKYHKFYVPLDELRIRQ